MWSGRFVYKCLCVSTYRLEVNTVRLPQSLSKLFFETRSLFYMELKDSAKGCVWATRVYLSLSPQNLGLQSTPWCLTDVFWKLFLVWMLRIQTRILELGNKHFNDDNIICHLSSHWSQLLIFWIAYYYPFGVSDIVLQFLFRLPLHLPGQPPFVFLFDSNNIIYFSLRK